MGLGIEARYGRCARYWRRHIELCKEFQRSALAELPQGGTVAVLGAGRLYDLDVELLKSRFSRIELFDADPGSLRIWRALLPRGRSVDYHLTDLTGCFDAWRGELRRFLARGRPGPAEVAEFLQQLHAPNPAPLPGSFDCVLSINLLSQIPIYWRDLFLRAAERKLGLAADARGDLPAPVQAALDASLGRLQAAHLEMLARSAREKVVLISDCEFMYYNRCAAGWQVESALHVPLPAKGSTAPVLAGFATRGSDSWLWHIAPQDVEQPDYGQIHGVQAWALERQTSRDLA